MNLLTFAPRSKAESGFTLVEMLVSVSVLAIMLVIISAISLQVSRAYTRTTGTIEGFRDARAAFESMTRTISHATLNTYYDYYDSSGHTTANYTGGAFVPTTYGRQSQMHFVSGTASGTQLISLQSIIPYPITHGIFFQAPLGDTDQSNYIGLNNSLNGCGFYLTYGLDPSTPAFLGTTTVPKLYRFRLMQFTEPTENLSVYDPSIQNATSNTAWDQWYLGPLGTTSVASVSQLAQNIVALIILPRLSSNDNSDPTTLAPSYDYDSRANSMTLPQPLQLHQLPPVVDITMVAIDESSALKLGNTAVPPNLLAGANFAQASLLSTDLETLENNLSATTGNAAGNHIPLHFRVFHSEVALSSAKWSN